MGLPVAAGMGIEPASVATHFTLRCSVLHRCANQEGYYNTVHGVQVRITKTFLY